MIRWIHRKKNQLTALSGILIVSALLAGAAGLNGTVRDALLIAATCAGGVPIAIKAYQAARMKAFSIELLVTVAVIGAILIQEYIESAVVTFLFMFGAWLESRTLEKTRASLQTLIDMAPQEATVVRDGKSIVIPADEVVVGDRVILRSGGKVPVDGYVVSGEASLDEAAITGESKLVSKQPGHRVFSGTIVDSGFIEVIADKTGMDTTFAKIIELVEEAQEAKSPTERYLDRFATFYTPSVIVLAVVVWLVTRNVHLAITFLVVACPGALVIGAPVSIVAGIGNGARNGVLVKGGDVMDRLSRVDTIVFDKTGTLTEGRPTVTDIRLISTSHDKKELLRIVAAAETISEHHLGRAIVRTAEEKNIRFQPLAETVKGEIVKGSGLRAMVGDHRVVIGNRLLMNTEGIDISTEDEHDALDREKAGQTVVFAAVDGQLAAIISIADQVREDAVRSLAGLRKRGVRRMIMLTGDNRHTAQRVAEYLKLDDYYAELLPEDKVAFVQQLKAKGHTVAMAGDGINDAPAIATAHIGLAMGGGTDVSMETADVVLMADRLHQFAHAYSLAKATVRNMKQNTWFAVGTVLLLLAGVLNGTIHLASGMFIHEASILFVILNAMRLIRFADKT